MPGRNKTWNGELGDGGFVVYGKNTIRSEWTAADNDDKYNDVFEFESSSMYPFSGNGTGEYHIDEVLWDEDTQTVCIILDD